MADWPLVGRTSELALLGRWLGDAGLRGGLLVGDAGVGKTRLAREFEQAAREADMATAWAVGTRAAAELPFGALATLLPEVDRGQPDRGISQADLIRRSALGMLERAGRRRLVLVVDDAHLLDNASATLIHQLAYMASCFVLAVVRAGESVPDPVTALWKDGLAERLDLPGLGPEAVQELLCAVLGGHVDEASAARLASHSEGNAFFLHALIQGAQSDGTLRLDSGVWWLARPLSPSAQLMELVEAQIGALAPGERDVLEIISYGGSLSTEQFCAVADPAVIENLERKGLIVSGVGNRGEEEFQLRHPLYGDVVRQRMPRMRVQSVARQLASTLASDGSSDELSLRLAVWQLDSGRAHPDVVLEGARVSRWRYDFDLAHRLAEAALRLGAGFEAALFVAEIAALRGRPEEAERQLKMLAATVTTDEERGRVACLRLENLAVSVGNRSEAMRVAADAEAAITDPYWRDQVAARRLVSMLAAEGPENLVVSAIPLLERSTGSARLFTAFTAGWSLARCGQITAGLKIADEAYQEHLSLTEPMRWYPWMHLFNRCQGLAAAGRFAEADALALTEYEKGVAEGSLEARAWFCWHRASTVGITGRVRTLEHHAREALALFHQVGQPNLYSTAAVPLALALALLAKPVEAAEVLDSDPLAAEPPVWNAVDRGCARAWIAVAQGRISEGCELLKEAATLGDQLGDLIGAANALHGLARLGHPKLGRTRMAVLAQRVEGELVSAQAAHVEALCRRDARALESVSDRFASMGATLLGAESSYDAALLWRQRSDPRRAAAVERRGAMLVASCEGAMTPALQGIAPRIHLTRSERETAMLAAAGHSNREMADLLHLSIRTVENRLQLVYKKLGVSRRDELAAALD